MVEVNEANRDILYGVSGASDALHTIDPATGALTTVGALGINIGVSGLAYDWTNDALYLTDVGSDSLYSVNPNTGQATLIGSVAGVVNPVALIYVPEPSAALGLMVGVLALGWSRGTPRRHRS